MANKSYSAVSGSMTKIRAEQIKSEDGALVTLAGELAAIKGQIADIIGAGVEYKEEVPANVQLLDLDVHLDASSATVLEVKNQLNVQEAADFDAAVTMQSTLGVSGSAVFAAGITVNTAAGDFNAGITANEIKIDGDTTAGRLYIVGGSNEIADSADLLFSGGKLAVTGIVSGSAALQGASVAVDGAATIGNGMTVNGAAADFNAGVTANEIKIDGDTAQRLYIVGSTGELKDEEKLTFDGSELRISGSFEATADAVIGGTLGVSGESTLASAKVSDLTNGRVVLAGADGALQDDAQITWTAGVLTVSGSSFSKDVVIAGDLTVNGTTTTVNSTTLMVDDKNIELGTVGTPTDVTADGGGITLKGATDKTIIWLDSTDAWTFNQHVHVSGEISGSGALKIAGAATLNGGLTVNAAVADFNAGITANEIKIDSDVANRLYMVGASGEIMDSADLTYAASQLSVVGAISGSGALFGERVDVDGGVQAGMVKIDGDVAQRLYIVDTDGSMKDEALMTFNGTRLAVTGQVSGSAQVSGASFLADGLGDVGTLRVRGQSQFQGLVKLDAGVADVSGSIIPSVNNAFQVGSSVRRYTSLFAGTADLNGALALDMARAGEQVIKKAGSGDLVLSSSVAAGYIKFDDAYRGATLLNTATAGLKLANSGEWATFATSFPTVDSILGAFNALAAGGGAEKGFFVAAAGVAAETAVDISAGTGMGDMNFAALTKDNSMVFFNGQLLRSGSVANLAAPASADYSFDGGAAAVKFAFAVEIGDQLVVQKL